MEERWEPLRLNDDAWRVVDCFRACFHDEWRVRTAARLDWLLFVTGFSLVLGVGLALGVWIARWLA
jgi:hypothetical protein